MPNRLKEKCGQCYFWDNGGFLSVDSGDCCRYPTKVKKNKNEGCGEFKPKKGVEYLWEERNETDS